MGTLIGYIRGLAVLLGGSMPCKLVSRTGVQTWLDNRLIANKTLDSNQVK